MEQYFVPSSCYSNGTWVPGAISVSSSSLCSSTPACLSSKEDGGTAPSQSSVKDESAPNGFLHGSSTKEEWVSKQNSCEEIENVLDTLVDQMQNVCSLTHNYYQKMISCLKSSDLEKRLEATRVFRKSLSVEKNTATSFHTDQSDKILVHRFSEGQTPSTSSISTCSPLSNPANALSKSSQFLGCKNGHPYASSSMMAPSCSANSSIDSLSSRNLNNWATPFSESTPTIAVTIQDLIEANVVPYIIDSLYSASHLHLKLESVLLLAKLVSGTSQQTHAVVNDSSLIQGLLLLLLEQRTAYPIEFRNAIFTVIRNVAIDSEELRNMILHTPGAVACIVTTALESVDATALRTCYVVAFAHHAAHFADIHPIAKFLADCIRHQEDPQILSIACQGFVNMCEKAADVENVLSLRIIPNIVSLMKHTNPFVVFDALSVIAKIAYSGSNAQINHLVEHGTVDILVQILKNPNLFQSATRSRACNVLGNIGCETPYEVQAVIDTNVFPLLVNIFRFDPDYNTRVEAAYAVCAAASRADCTQVGYIVSCTSSPAWADECVAENNCMQLIADMLELVSESDPTNSSNLKLCRAILRGLDNILKRGSEEGRKHGLWENPYAYLFKSVQGHSKLAQMRFFPEYTVVSKTNEILETYFYTTYGRSIYG
ncbi:Armadillo/beta-catenin family repeat-containing protein [Cardiosporidium cionae]|uniref:Armadillo/beta-catenin family repeat-containing protein n=1 Tax=Cardiosporidium cionae TaxID=476202 RepID=A0ABQ7J7X6_9APIC|nr:Armadillo/beta-catenin family repeat-containing protein [Cardiosporidium cionae]|eukprot:KAF8820101.1 Armadillo/beta-catenin family repeat-containing protein [Cardiosporidium cionae]